MQDAEVTKSLVMDKPSFQYCGCFYTDSPDINKVIINKEDNNWAPEKIIKLMTVLQDCTVRKWLDFCFQARW